MLGIFMRKGTNVQKKSEVEVLDERIKAMEKVILQRDSNLSNILSSMVGTMENMARINEELVAKLAEKETPSEKVSRVETIRKASEKKSPVKSKTKLLLPEITPMSLGDIRKISSDDKAAIFSDILGVEVFKGADGRSLFIQNAKGEKSQVNMMSYREKMGVYSNHLKIPGYVIISDKITDKFYIKYVRADELTKGGSFSFSRSGKVFSDIKKGSALTLSVLKSKFSK